LESGDTTDLTHEAAEQLAGLLMTAVPPRGLREGFWRDAAGAQPPCSVQLGRHGDQR
jgi:hypothetical protein